MKCVYSKFCKYYQPKAHTCNDEGEAEWYCGAYSQFEDAKK